MGLSRVASHAYQHIKPPVLSMARFARRAFRVWQNRLPLPLLALVPITAQRLEPRLVNDIDNNEISFNPVAMRELLDMKEAMNPVLGAFGLELAEVQEHEFRPAVRKAGPIANSMVSHKMMAQNAIAALTVKLNGAESGTAENYGSVKTLIDGIGATSTFKALTVLGDILAEYGYHMVTVATEGTASHPKLGESPLGNPTIDIGTMFPGRVPLEKIAIDNSGKVYIYKGSTPIYIGMDVVECTEIASTSLEAFQEISGRPGKPKDNGAVAAFHASDKVAVLADTYANKIIVSPEAAKALRDAGIKISLSPFSFSSNNFCLFILFTFEYE